MTPPVEHDTISAVVAELREGESDSMLYDWRCRYADRLERIDAEMRKELWVACAERQHQIERAERLDDELADLRAKLAACERNDARWRMFESIHGDTVTSYVDAALAAEAREDVK